MSKELEDRLKVLNEYEKVVIDRLYLRGVKDEFSFTTNPSTNKYLSTREVKYWYFWTD